MTVSGGNSFAQGNNTRACPSYLMHLRKSESDLTLSGRNRVVNETKVIFAAARKGRVTYYLGKYGILRIAVFSELMKKRLCVSH